MKQRSNTIILFGIAFFFIGGAIVALFLGTRTRSSHASASRTHAGSWGTSADRTCTSACNR
jgi:hypothetical protein